MHPHVFLLVFHQLLPPTFFRGTNIFSWRCNTLQHTDSSESRNRSLSVSLRKTPVCSLNKQTCQRLMHKQEKLGSMARLCLSFDIHHFEIGGLLLLTLWWDFKKEASFWPRFRLLILTRLAGLVQFVSRDLLHISNSRKNFNVRMKVIFGEKSLSSLFRMLRQESTTVFPFASAPWLSQRFALPLN